MRKGKYIGIFTTITEIFPSKVSLGMRRKSLPGFKANDVIVKV